MYIYTFFCLLFGHLVVGLHIVQVVKAAQVLKVSSP